MPEEEVQEIDVPSKATSGGLSIADALAEVKTEAAAQDEQEADTTPSEDAEDTSTLSPPESEDTEEAAGQTLATAEESNDSQPVGERDDYKSLSVEKKEKYLEEKIQSSNKRFTEHSQEHSSRMKELDQLVQLQKAYSLNPRSTLELLAKEHGLQVVDQTQSPTPTNGDQQVTPGNITSIVKDVVNQQLTQEGMGHIAPSLDPIVEKIAAAMEKANQTVMDERLGPVESYFKEQKESILKNNITSAFEEMDARYGASWRKEQGPEMDALQSKWPLGDDLSITEYLDGLYQKVNGPSNKKTAAATAAAKTLKKIAKSESSVETLPAGQGVTSKTIAIKPPVDLKDSWNQSKRELSGSRR